MATATNSAAWAAEYMARSHGGRFLLETKLDGAWVAITLPRFYFTAFAIPRPVLVVGPPSASCNPPCRASPAGERMQVHRCRPPPGTAGPDQVSYFSRKAIEHGERSNYRQAG